MSVRSGHRDERDEFHAGSFSRFIRSLLDGVPWSERAEGEEVLRIPAPGNPVLRLHNSNGRTCIRGEDRDDVEVRAEKYARAESAEAARRMLESIRVASEETSAGLELEVEVPRRWNRRGLAHLTLLVPRGMRIDATAANGKLFVEGIRGPVRARSSNGSVCVDDVIGDVEVETTNARVTCSCCRGNLQARSSNGKIEISSHCGSVDASTSNGLIRATVDEVGAGGVQLATSNGRIVLELPEHADVDVDIRVDNGIIRNERELVARARDTAGRLRGRLGRGGAPVKLRTSNGSISLR